MIKKTVKIAVIPLISVLMLSSVSALTTVQIDGFEDNDILEYSGETSFFQTSQNRVKSGLYSLEGTGDEPDPRTIGSTSGLSEYLDQGEQTQFWMYTESSGPHMGLIYAVQDAANPDSGGGYIAVIRVGSTDNVGICELDGVDSFGGCQWDQASLATDNYYKGDVKWYPNGNMTFTLFNEAGSQIGKTTKSDTTYTDGGIGWWYHSGYGQFDNVITNTPPNIANVSTTPTSWTLGSSINVSSEVYDINGNNSVSYVTADVYENNTQIVNNASLTNTAGTTWQIDNLFTVNQENVYYNLTVTAVDDQGASDTFNTSQFIQNLPPKIRHLQPVNNSRRFSYYPDYSVRIRNDNDNFPGENITCDLYDSGQYFRTVSALETATQSERTFSGNLSNDVGDQQFKTSCANGARNNKTTFYEIKRFAFISNSTQDIVFETENTTYSTTVTVGDMVNNVTTFLNWNETQETERFASNTGINNYTFDHYFRPDLVQNNATGVSFLFNATINYDLFNGMGLSSDSRLTTEGNQTVYHGFYWKNHTTNKNRYIIRDTVDYNSTIVNRTSAASIEGSLQNNQTNVLKQLSRTESFNIFSKYNGQTKTNDINQDKIALGVSSKYTVSFRDKSREFSSNTLRVELYDIIFQKCSSGGENALTFNTFDENDLTTPVVSDLVAAVEVWNPSDPTFKKSFNFSSENQTSHEFCIEPGFAEYKIDSTDKLIQYEESSSYQAVGDYALRSYFLINETINNQTTTIPLYMRWRNETSRVRFDVVDSDGDPLDEIIVKNERYFPEQDKYIPVSMIRTGSTGESESFLEVNEIYYRFKMYRNGELVEEKSPQIIPSDLEVTLVLGDELLPSYYDKERQVTSTCNVVNNTLFECSYSSSTEAVDKVTLNVDEQLPVSFNRTCSVSSTSSSGTLQCDGINLTSSKYKYSLVALFNDGNKVTVDSGWIGSLTDNYGETGLFMTFMIGITLGFAGLWKPEPAITLFAFAMIVSYVAGFIVVSQTALISLVALGALLLWRYS